ncbi:MAG TPA: hypothetical protein VD815_11060 [Candidatus Saccharimonadales bacterium]|nr:hypothetical protein [Thermoproteota archaeon]HYG00623.1 hypothetical protein [Candidatus Saccharimonadales bacterium]
MNQAEDFRRSEKEEIIMCEFCGNMLEACMCVCPYCGIRDKCECCVHDAMTGG